MAKRLQILDLDPDGVKFGAPVLWDYCSRCSSVKPMNKLDFASRLAKEFHRSQAKAADDVDTFIYHLIKDLKRPTGASDAAPGKTQTQVSLSPTRPKEKR